MDPQIAERVEKVLLNRLGCDKKLIVPEARILDELGADSLDAVEITMDLEREFGLEISDEDLEKIVTVGDIVSYITNRLSPPNPQK